MTDAVGGGELVAEYDVDEATLRPDLGTLLEELLHRGLADVEAA